MINDPWIMPYRLLLMLVVHCIFLTSVSSLKPINIAGFFNPYTADGYVDKDQMEHLAVFMMAIDEINRNQTMLPGYELKYIIRSAYTYVQGATLANNVAKNYNIVAAVGALPFEETAGIDRVFAEEQIVMAHSVAMSTELGIGATYKYKVQTPPLDSFQGMVLQHILCNHFHTKRYVIFAANDEYGTKAAMESGDMTYCVMDVLTTFLFAYSVEDFTAIIQNALEFDATVFLFFCGPKNAAMILEQGYNLGLFHEGTQIMSGKTLMTSELFDYFSPTADVASIMKGFIALDYWPDYSVTRTPEGKAFLTAFFGQKETISRCDGIKDMTNYSFLYPSGNTSAGPCHGLNYSLYSSGTVSLNSMAGLTYDATYLIAHGLKEMLAMGQPMTSPNLLQTLLNNVSFNGATGVVKVYIGMTLFNYYAFGDREVGHHYRLMNFQQDRYLQNVNDSFALVSLWTVEEGVKSCDGVDGCTDIITTSPNNTLTTGYPLYTFDKPPTVIKIGGIFTPYDEDGNPSKTQIENLQAFLMAIDEINNKKDGIYDSLLPNTQLVVTIGSGIGHVGMISAVQQIMDSFYFTGVNCVVNGMDNTETITSASLLNSYEILQANAVATDATLGDFSLYPRNIRMSPLETFEGMVLGSILCSQNQRKVVIFSSTSMASVHATADLLDGTYCDIDVLAQYIIDSENQNVDESVLDASNGGGKIFVLYVDTAAAAAILKKAYEANLLSDGTQVYISSNAMTTSFFDEFEDMTQEEIANMMKGVIGIEYWPDYWVSRSNEGKKFLKRWKQQSYTGPKTLSDGTIRCDGAMDNSANYLYRNADGSTCYGLNFTKYATTTDLADGSVFPNPYAAHTYDMTLALAMGLHHLIDSGHESIDPAELQDAMIINVSFFGASGFIDFYEGSTSNSLYARGSREVGNVYKIKNFNGERYLINASDAFPHVAIWIDGFTDCDSTMECVDIVYNTQDNTVPTDTRRDVVVTLPSSVRAIFFVSAAIIITAMVTIQINIAMNWDHKVIKASQPGMLSVIVVGVIFGGLRVLNTALEISDATCQSGIWFGHIAFGLVFSGLFLKTWRVNRIVNNPTLKRIKITEKDVLIRLGIVMFILIIYLIFNSVFGNPHYAEYRSTANNQTTRKVRCSYENPSIQTALFCLEGLSLIYGMRLCLAVKNVPDKVNESKAISAVLTMTTFLSMIGFPTIFLLNLDPVMQQIISALCFSAVSFDVIAMYFSPKIYPLIEHRLRVFKRYTEKINPSESSHGSYQTEDASDTLLVAGMAALKHKDVDEKNKICIEQIGKWQALLLRLGEEGQSDGSRNRRGKNSQSRVNGSSLLRGGSNSHLGSAKSAVSRLSVAEANGNFTDDVEAGNESHGNNTNQGAGATAASSNLNSSTHHSTIGNNKSHHFILRPKLPLPKATGNEIHVHELNSPTGDR